MIPDRLIKPVLSWWNALLGARDYHRQVRRDRKASRDLTAALDESLAAEGYPQVEGRF